MFFGHFVGWVSPIAGHFVPGGHGWHIRGTVEENKDTIMTSTTFMSMCLAKWYENENVLSGGMSILYIFFANL